MIMWDAAKNSSYMCKTIGGRSVQDEGHVMRYWYRDELQRACKRMSGVEPPCLRKHEYACALVAMIGIRRLEHFVTMRLIKSDTCSICKDLLKAPVFRCSKSGYHLMCIRNYMLVSHMFKDPITGREFTDDQLKWCDVLAARYKFRKVDGVYTKVKYDRDDQSLYKMRHDPERIHADSAQHSTDAEIELIIDAIGTNMDIMEHSTDVLFASHSLERYFRHLTHLSEETARQQIRDCIQRNTENNTVVNVLRNIQLKLDTWVREEFDVNDLDLDDLEPVYTFIPHPIIMHMFNALHHRFHQQAMPPTRPPHRVSAFVVRTSDASQAPPL